MLLFRCGIEQEMIHNLEVTNSYEDLMGYCLQKPKRVDGRSGGELMLLLVETHYMEMEDKTADIAYDVKLTMRIPRYNIDGSRIADAEVSHGLQIDFELKHSRGSEEDSQQPIDRTNLEWDADHPDYIAFKVSHLARNHKNYVMYSDDEGMDLGGGEGWLEVTDLPGKDGGTVISEVLSGWSLSQQKRRSVYLAAMAKAVLWVGTRHCDQDMGIPMNNLFFTAILGSSDATWKDRNDHIRGVMRRAHEAAAGRPTVGEMIESLYGPRMTAFLPISMKHGLRKEQRQLHPPIDVGPHADILDVAIEESNWVLKTGDLWEDEDNSHLYGKWNERELSAFDQDVKQLLKDPMVPPLPQPFPEQIWSTLMWRGLDLGSDAVRAGYDSYAAMGTSPNCPLPLGVVLRVSRSSAKNYGWEVWPATVEYALNRCFHFRLEGNTRCFGGKAETCPHTQSHDLCYECLSGGGNLEVSGWRDKDALKDIPDLAYRKSTVKHNLRVMMTVLRQAAYELSPCLHDGWTVAERPSAWEMLTFMPPCLANYLPGYELGTKE